MLVSTECTTYGCPPTNARSLFSPLCRSSASTKLPTMWPHFFDHVNVIKTSLLPLVLDIRKPDTRTGSRTRLGYQRNSFHPKAPYEVCARYQNVSTRRFCMRGGICSTRKEAPEVSRKRCIGRRRPWYSKYTAIYAAPLNVAWFFFFTSHDIHPRSSITTLPLRSCHLSGPSIVILPTLPA